MGQENINSLFRNVSAVPPGPSSIISSNQNSDSNPLSPYSSTQTLDSNPLAPPPELSYNQKERLVESIQSWEKSHGYPISTRVLSFKNQAFTYQFDKSGEYKPSKDTSKLKKKKSRKTNCSFRLSGNFSKRFNFWVVKVICPDHNHPPSIDPSTHPIQATIQGEQKEVFKYLSKAGVPPLKISQLSYTKLIITYPYKSPHNSQQKIPNTKKIPLMARLLWNQSYWNSGILIFYYKINNVDGQITSFFISHPDSMKLLNLFPTLNMMDCT